MKLNYRKTILVGMAFMSISAFWQMYDNIIPLILKNTFNMNEAVTGAVMAIDNILALFLLPVFGTLSDKVKTPLGKRTPFIVVGTAITVIAMFFMPKADNAGNLVMFLVMTGIVLLAMSFFRSPAVALMPDVTPRPLRSKGNAIINLTGTVGAIFALLMIKFVVGEGLRPDYTPLFLSLMGFMILCTVILVLTVHENKWAKIARQQEADAGIEEEEEETQTGKGTHLPKDKKKSLIFILLSVCFWYMAYNAVTTAFSRYATEVWGLEKGGYADCLMIATIAAIVAYIPIGLFASKIGRKKSILAGVVMLFAGFAFVGFFGKFSFLINIGFVVIGAGWAAINVNSFPMVVEIASAGDIGKYTGYYYTFSMAAQVITPILSGALLQYVSYRMLFPYATLFSALAFITMLNVHHGDVKPVKKKSILENLDVDD